MQWLIVLDIYADLYNIITFDFLSEIYLVPI